MTRDPIAIESVDNEVTEAMKRMREMILRKAPILMRAGRDTYRKVPYTTLTEEQKNVARIRILEGDTLAAIQRDLGCSYDSLRNLKKKLLKR